MELFSIITRPALNPLSSDSDSIAFFQDKATSTFIVKRESGKITAEMHCHNEKPNTFDEHAIDNVQKKLTSKVAINGFSSIQWKKLVTELFS